MDDYPVARGMTMSSGVPQKNLELPPTEPSRMKPGRIRAEIANLDQQTSLKAIDHARLATLRAELLRRSRLPFTLRKFSRFRVGPAYRVAELDGVLSIGSRFGEKFLVDWYLKAGQTARIGLDGIDLKTDQPIERVGPGSVKATDSVTHWEWGCYFDNPTVEATEGLGALGYVTVIVFDGEQVSNVYHVRYMPEVVFTARQKQSRFLDDPTRSAKHFSEAELREMMALLESIVTSGGKGERRFAALRNELFKRIKTRYLKLRPELVQARIVQLRNQADSDELDIALKVAAKRKIRIPPRGDYARKEIYRIRRGSLLDV